MSNIGWIKIHRKMLEWEWYKDSKVKDLFIHCLLKSNHRDKKWQGILIKKGSFLTSISKLSQELSFSPMQIRTAIKKLKSTNEITIETSSQYTIIQVVKHEQYQTNNKPCNKPITNEQQTDNKPITTTKKDKKDKKEKNVKNDKNNIPEFNEFLKYAKEKKSNVDDESVKLKYEAWKENSWKDGYDKPIKNWKSKLLNTLQYLKEKKHERATEIKQGIGFGKL